MIGAFRDPVLDIAPPEKESATKKTPTPEVKQKPEEAAKPAADVKAVKDAKPAKTPAPEVKPKSETALEQEVEIPQDLKTPMADYSTREERLKEITDKLEKGIVDLFQSGRYAEYLAVMAKFHNYSFGNILLIMAQCPDASRVAGYNDWKRKIGR